MEEGVASAKYRITYRFGKSGCIDEEICELPTEKKDERFSGICRIFWASRYGKYLLTQVNAFGSKADAKVFFELYDFDVQLRLLLFKYCKKAEVYFKSAIANAISLKTGDAGFS